VVVLCGYEHRYSLRSKLTALAVDRGFIVKEFRDY